LRGPPPPPPGPSEDRVAQAGELGVTGEIEARGHRAVERRSDGAVSDRERTTDNGAVVGDDLLEQSERGLDQRLSTGRGLGIAWDGVERSVGVAEGGSFVLEELGSQAGRDAVEELVHGGAAARV